MAIVRWNPILEMESLRHQMDRIFEEMTGMSNFESDSRRPAIELIDNDDYLTLRAELPGIEAKDLDISVTREAVTIKGEYSYDRENKDKGHFHSEFRYGKFERTVGLPVPINNNSVQAEFDNGILSLTLPKQEEARNRVVRVKLDQTADNQQLEAAVNNEATDS